jgi:hypothetical protein
MSNWKKKKKIKSLKKKNKSGKKIKLQRSYNPYQKNF